MKTLVMTMVMVTMSVINVSAETKTWKTTSVPTPPRVESRTFGHDNRHDDTHNLHADWQRCRHNQLDRHGNKTYCHSCGCEMVWKGNSRNGHFEVVPPRTTRTTTVVPPLPNWRR